MLTAVINCVLIALSCGGLQRPAAAPSPSPTPVYEVIEEPEASPETIATLRPLLYGDLPLDKLLEHIKPGSPGADEEPWRSFALALKHSKQGQPAEAKKDLRRVLSMPDPETRVLLSAWTALRALGERPPAGEADKVQGVVLELHNEAGVGTLAAYADGRARWLGGKGAFIAWEAPGTDKEIDSLIGGFLKAAEPVVRKTPAAERHPAAEVALEHFRVTVLTFGGIHVIDVYGPEVDTGHFTRPAFIASVQLLDGLTQRGNQRNK